MEKKEKKSLFQLVQCPHLRVDAFQAKDGTLRARMAGAVLLCRSCFREIVEECRTVTRSSDIDIQAIAARTVAAGDEGWDCVTFDINSREGGTIRSVLG